MKRRYTILGLAGVLAVALTVPALGGPTNPIADGAKSAKKIAQSAKKKAKKANQAAKAAQSSADSAQSSADSAQSTANGAQTSADAAQSTANDAATAAATAQTTADGATAAAAAAQSTADSAFKTKDFNGGTPSAVNSTNVKSVLAVCDAGDSLTGGGWTTTGAGNNDITAAINSSYFTAWLVTMEEIGAGTAETWGVTATVECVGAS